MFTTGSALSQGSRSASSNYKHPAVLFTAVLTAATSPLSRWSWQETSWSVCLLPNRNFVSSLCENVSKSFRTESMKKYTHTVGITRWEATQRFMAAKLTRLTHRIAIQLHLGVESCTICSSRSRLPVRKLLDTPSYTPICDKLFCNI
jgi:hypothetical protein